MMIEREAITMVYALHKFHHYLLGNKFIFYVDHMALLYLGPKTPNFKENNKVATFFLEYDFLIIYKLGRFHSMSDALFQMFDFIEENEVLDQIMDVSLFLLQSVSLQEFLSTSLLENLWFNIAKSKRKN
jgi:hypothetical protein